MMNLKLHTIGHDIEGISETFGLEISRIRKETPQNTIKSRLSVKEKQILKRVDKDTICYVSIIEFSKPEAKFIQV